MRTTHRVGLSRCSSQYCSLFGVDDAALIGAAATVIGAGTSAVAQGSMNRKTREFNREEAAKQREWSEKMYHEQNQWNLDMWNRNNEYNSPAAQVERMRDAGLNPLFYGLDGSSSSAIQAAAPLGYERAVAPNMVNPLSAGIDAATRVAQVSNIQADTAKKNNETLTETQRRENMLTENLKLTQELKNLAAQEGLTNAQTSQINKALEWTDRMNEAIIAEKESSKKLNDSQKKRIDELLEGEKILQSKTIQDFDEKWKKISAEISQIAKENNLLDKDLENYALNHMQNGFLGTGLSFPNFIRELKDALSKPRKPDKPVESPSGVNTAGDSLYSDHGLPIS